MKIVAQKVKAKYRKNTVILQSESNKKNMNIKSIITAAMALLVSTGCSGTKQQQTESSTTNETTTMAKDGKATRRLKIEN